MRSESIPSRLRFRRSKGRTKLSRNGADCPASGFAAASSKAGSPPGVVTFQKQLTSVVKPAPWHAGEERRVPTGASHADGWRSIVVHSGEQQQSDARKCPQKRSLPTAWRGDPCRHLSPPPLPPFALRESPQIKLAQEDHPPREGTRLSMRMHRVGCETMDSIPAVLQAFKVTCEVQPKKR